MSPHPFRTIINSSRAWKSDSWTSAVLRFIELHPGGFQRLQGVLRQAPLERFPFVVIYAVSGDLIEVVRVFNTKQHPRKKLPRRRKGV